MPSNEFMNSRMSGILLVGAASIAIVFGVTKVLREHRSKVPGSSTDLIQEASLAEIKDRIQTSASPITLVNLWASWCEPCKVELPALVKLRETYKDKGFDLMLISLDHEDARDEALEFLKSNNVNFPTFIKGKQSTGFVRPLFPMWQGAIPASFLVNRDLQILEGWIGETTAKQFESKIVGHLPKP